MKRILIGSTAMSHYWDIGREPKDVDYFCNDPTAEGDNLWHSVFDEIWPEDVDRIATPEELITVKYSHLFWDLPNGSYWKHLADYRMMRRRGYEVNGELFQKLYTVWLEVHGAKQMDLKKEEDEFFKDAVKRVYIHDTLHQSIAHEFGKPRYERYLKPGHTVDMDMKKVWAQPKEEIVLLFQEEIEATALERIMVPRNYETSPHAAYLWSLRRCLTSLLKGKSARFVLDNIEEFVKPTNYMVRHNNGKKFLVKIEESK